MPDPRIGSNLVDARPSQPPPTLTPPLTNQPHTVVSRIRRVAEPAVAVTSNHGQLGTHSRAQENHGTDPDHGPHRRR